MIFFVFIYKWGIKYNIVIVRIELEKAVHHATGA